jgi:hypothetical protein
MLAQMLPAQDPARRFFPYQSHFLFVRLTAGGGFDSIWGPKRVALSSRGLGRVVLSHQTRVRIPVALPTFKPYEPYA